MTISDDRVRESVRDRYRSAAIGVASGAGDACAGEEGRFGSSLYDPDNLGSLPESAVAASLGCGNPFAMAELAAGETVLDLGSGGGIDVLLSARRVGPTGKAYGLDMTDEMLDLARANAAEAGVDNVEFVKGVIEDIPLPGASVDVVISNCVVNLSADKAAVFSGIRRVLRPGGRVAISDVVLDDDVSDEARQLHGECVAGALTFGEYRRLLAEAGLVDVSIETTHPVAVGASGAIVRARRP